MRGGPCRHCSVRVANACRQLCKTCYGIEAIRTMYPPLVTYTLRRGLESTNGSEAQTYERPLPPLPTAALPGTEDKIDVMAERARQRQCIWHPDDPSIRAEPGETSGERIYRNHYERAV